MIRHRFFPLPLPLYRPPDDAARNVESRTYRFTAPLGPIEADDLRWYLERNHVWPRGVFRERARRVEAALPRWGEDLFQAALGARSADGPLQHWRAVSAGAE